MSEMKASGTITVIKGTQKVSEKFSKREFVIKTDDDYPQDLLFELTQDKCSAIDGYVKGQKVDVHFNLKGREWMSPQGEAKYFVSLNAWRITRLGDAPAPTAPAPADDSDDLPF
jgi:hypothetical protein